MSLWKRPKEVPHPICHVRSEWEDGHLWTGKWILTKCHNCNCLDLRLPSLQNYENLMFFTLPSPWYQRRQWHPTPVLLPGESHGRRSLVGCSPWGRYELDTTERLHFHFSLFTFMHWRRKWQPTPVFLPGESQGQRSLVGCCLWGRTELDTTEATWQQQQQPMIFSHRDPKGLKQDSIPGLIISYLMYLFSSLTLR